MRRALLTLALIAAIVAIAAPAQAQSPQRALVWAVGDGGDGSRAAKTLAARIRSDRPDRFLYLGDVYPNGTAAEFRRNYTTVYGPLNRITEPTIGNHEWANRGSGYLPYWRRAKGRPQRLFYSFRLAGWEIINLNSQLPRSAAQLRWLRSRLSAAPGTCRLAYFHLPRFSAGALHGDQAAVAPLWNALRGHARLVVNAHEHTSQRFRLRDGLTEYVAGSGGAAHYRLRRDPRLAWARTGTNGALRIVLEPGRARLEFRSAGGRLLDASRVTCRV